MQRFTYLQGYRLFTCCYGIEFMEYYGEDPAADYHILHTFSNPSMLEYLDHYPH